MSILLIILEAAPPVTPFQIVFIDSEDTTYTANFKNMPDMFQAWDEFCANPHSQFRKGTMVIDNIAVQDRTTPSPTPITFSGGDFSNHLDQCLKTLRTVERAVYMSMTPLPA